MLAIYNRAQHIAPKPVISYLITRHAVSVAHEILRICWETCNWRPQRRQVLSRNAGFDLGINIKILDSKRIA